MGVAKVALVADVCVQVEVVTDVCERRYEAERKGTAEKSVNGGRGAALRLLAGNQEPTVQRRAGERGGNIAYRRGLLRW